MLDEVGSSLDPKRVHFLGKLPYAVRDLLEGAAGLARARLSDIPVRAVVVDARGHVGWCLVIRSQPVQEVIRGGSNGLVDFFAPDQVAAWVIEALEDVGAHAALRRQARQTIVKRYNLSRVCLPAHLALVNKLAVCGT